ncbi:hypothetical protein JTB14_032938 [Gonioctena quinquepunctata]|nr:hypothetical protein JTB14_032938 [Gonioctena quinquepunctata]
MYTQKALSDEKIPENHFENRSRLIAEHESTNRNEPPIPKEDAKEIADVTQLVFDATLEYLEINKTGPALSPEEYTKQLTELMRNKLADYKKKNSPIHPPEKEKAENYEDEYFANLSSAESGDEFENSSENFRKTEEILEQIDQQKSSPEPMHIEEVENPPITIVKSEKSTEMPPPTEPPKKLIKKHSVSDNSDAQNKNLYPIVLVQSDGPSDTDGMFSSSSDEENIADLSMKKKNIQHARNTKRRKTVKTHDEIELDKDCQKAGTSGALKRSSGDHYSVDRYSNYHPLN